MASLLNCVFRGNTLYTSKLFVFYFFFHLSLYLVRVPLLLACLQYYIFLPCPTMFVLALGIMFILRAFIMMFCEMLELRFIYFIYYFNKLMLIGRHKVYIYIYIYISTWKYIYIYIYMYMYIY